jgi:hypothetical protein
MHSPYVTEEWRRLHNEELHALNASPNTIRVTIPRRIRLAGNVACMGDRRGAYTVLMTTPEARRPLERPRREWEDNIKMDIQ